MKFGQNVEEIDPENLAKTACQNFYRFQRYSTEKVASVARPRIEPGKFLTKIIFFAFLESRYFNSQKNHKIEKLKFFPFMRSSRSDT